MGRSMYGKAGEADLKHFHSLLSASGAVLTATNVDHKEFLSLLQGAGDSKGAAAAADKYTGGESRIAAISSSAHVALAFPADPALASAMTALLSLTATSPLTSFRTGPLVGIAGSADAGTADVMCGALADAVTGALKADADMLKRALAKAKAADAFAYSGSSQDVAAALTSAVLGGGAVGEAGVIEAAGKVTADGLKKAMAAAVAQGASVASVGEIGKVSYKGDFKF